MGKAIIKYNNAFGAADKAIAKKLAIEFDRALTKAESKVWHRTAVWFLDGNPIVGYSKRKAGMAVLFWSGQSFKTKGLTKEGSFKAAEKIYTDVTEIKAMVLRAWLKEAKTIQWDYKNIVKRKGKLVRLT